MTSRIHASWEKGSKDQLNNESEVEREEREILLQRIEAERHMIRQLKGEALEGLSIQEMSQLEKKLGMALRRVKSEKAQHRIAESSQSIIKVNQLTEENAKLVEENANLCRQINQRHGKALENSQPPSSRSQLLELNVLGKLTPPFVMEPRVDDSEELDTSLKLGSLTSTDSMAAKPVSHMQLLPTSHSDEGIVRFRTQEPWTQLFEERQKREREITVTRSLLAMKMTPAERSQGGFLMHAPENHKSQRRL